jgi:signal transduction histidine kinase
MADDPRPVPAPLDHDPRAPGAAAGLAPDAVERLLAVEADERSLRRLVTMLADTAPEADCAALLLADGDRFVVDAAIGLDDATPGELRGGLLREVADASALRVFTSPGSPFPAGTRCGAAAPVRAGETAGLLLLGTRSAETLSAGAIALLRLAADRAALALERGRLARARAAAEDEARGAREEMASRRKAVDYILGIVGHDLRNPLGAIHMSAALLQKRGALEGWQARAIERTRSSAGRMARIIADLLSYTRTRLGNGLPITRRPGRLDDIARRVVDELAAANPDRRIAIAARGDPAGEWDPDRLEQVVSNLVSNAVDHGDPESPVEVEVAGEEDAVVLRVRNRGPGLPPEVLAHLFEPFSRPPDEKSRKGSGLGLGLYIAREIVRGHGGDIGVTSEGETVITVRLPRRAPTVEE